MYWTDRLWWILSKTIICFKLKIIIPSRKKVHPVSFFSKNSICNVNTRGFQSPDFGIPPISFFEAEIRFSRRTLNCVCAICNFLNWFFNCKEGNIYCTNSAGGMKIPKFDPFKDHSLLAKFWILFPLNLWNQQWAHWLTDNKILSWSYPPCLQVEVWAELWNNKFWVSTLSQTWFLSKKIPWPQILRQKNYDQKHVIRDIF